MKTCLQCTSEIAPDATRSNRSRICSDRCRRARKAQQVKAAQRRQTKVCSREGCSNRVRSQGLCSTHYNATRPNRHPKVEKPCDHCGATTLKPKNSRYAGTYCSTTCRDDAVRKVWPHSKLPANHWARWYGKTCQWKPQRERAAFFANTCDDCGTTFVEHAYGVPSTYCSEACSKRVSRRRRRAREHDAPGSFTLTQVIHQYIKQGSVCAYCRCAVNGLPDPEHVVPLSRGGRNDMSNLVAACRPCNTDKGDLTLTEWAEDRARRGLPPVTTTLTGPAYTRLYATEPVRPAWRHRTDVRLAA